MMTSSGCRETVAKLCLPIGTILAVHKLGRLTPDDTDNVRDLYRYDFQTGELQRLSMAVTEMTVTVMTTLIRRNLRRTASPPLPKRNRQNILHNRVFRDQ